MATEIAGCPENDTGTASRSVTAPYCSVALNPELIVGDMPETFLAKVHIARSPILWTIHPSDSIRDRDYCLKQPNNLPDMKRLLRCHPGD